MTLIRHHCNLDYFLRQEHGPLPRYVKLRVAHAPGMPVTFSLPPWVSDPDMHHGTCVTHVPWCIPGSLTSGFFLRRWQGKRSRHSRHMRNPQITYLVRGPLCVKPPKHIDMPPRKHCQTPCSKAFYWEQSVVHFSKFQWSVFLRV